MLTRTKAREMMSRDGIKYARSYKFAYRNDDDEIVFISNKTGKKCIVTDWSDIGGFSGCSIRNK